MHGKTLWVVVIVAALLVLSVGVAGALPGHWLEPDGPQVAGKINYQGRLTSPAGTALSGSYTLRFQVYDDPGAGTLLWDSGPVAVAVAKGLFNATLNVPTTYVDGQALWLALTVNGELLTPRQEITPVPYALSLKPGARIAGSPSAAVGGGVVDVTLSDYSPLAAAVRGYAPTTGSAVYGESLDGAGVSGQSHTTYGVKGSSFGGWGGYFYSQTGNGLVAESGGLDTWDHAGSFRAAMGYGVYAVSTGNAAVRGEAGVNAGSLPRPGGTVGVVGLGDTRGVWGASNTGEGVFGVSQDAAGVYGETNSNSSDIGSVTGQKMSGNGVAMFARKYGDSGWAMRGVNQGTSGSGVAGESTNYVGVWGESANDSGVYGRTNRPDNNYGLYTPDNLYSLNVHLAGAVMQVVQNGGDTALEPGDVVVFSGIVAPLAAGNPPVIQVARVASVASPAVAGVMYRRYNIQSALEQAGSDGAGQKRQTQGTLDGPAALGDYLLMVVQGPAQVKVDGTVSAVHPGDLLGTSQVGGYAAAAGRATTQGQGPALPGTVFGKALEPLAEGQKQIYVYVTLQ